MKKPPAKKAAQRAAPKKAVVKPAGSAKNDVDALMKSLDHPLKKDIEAVRQIVLSASPSVREGVKWNAPSFRTTDWFATLNLRSKEAVQLIFHTGAKVKESAVVGVKVADPAGLAKWLAKDRCLVTLGAGKDLVANKKAFEAFVRGWIKVM
jgi:hypothetical protein